MHIYPMQEMNSSPPCTVLRTVRNKSHLPRLLQISGHGELPDPRDAGMGVENLKLLSFDMDYVRWCKLDLPRQESHS
jgi:hypothetical protein